MLAHLLTLVSLRLQLMKATVLAESSSYFIFSPGYLPYYNVYRCESGRCCLFPFFLTLIILLTFQVFLYINILISFNYKWESVHNTIHQLLEIGTFLRASCLHFQLMTNDCFWIENEVEAIFKMFLKKVR